MTTTIDEFDGVGGSYVVDETGKRSLVERTFDPNDKGAGQNQETAPDVAPANDTDQEEA